jgi:L-histidine Nalpha-methyltransferase
MMNCTLPRLRNEKPVIPAPLDTFRADVLRGLHAPARELPCKHFYDATGSKLFDRICELQEYYLTRTELEIMRRHAADMAGLLGRNCLLIEYGSGSSVKTRLLLDRLVEPAAYVPVDLSGDYLEQTARSLAADYPQIPVLPLCADFSGPLELPGGKRPGRRVVYFPGSTVGNFTPAEAVALLGQTAQRCGPGGALLLGADLKKDPRVITAAYNDADGVTAAFNLNLLARINRELGADFQLEQFWHHAFYHPVAGRIEMHLVSRRDQEIHVGGEAFFLAEGESIRTEYSYKYSLNDLRELAAAAGFEVRQVWTDDLRYFSVLYLAVRAG